MSIRHLALFSSTRTVCMTGTSLLMMSKLHADRIETRKVFYRFMRRFMRPCDPLADRISPILMSFSMLLVKDVYDIALYMARTPCSAQTRLALTSATTGGPKGSLYAPIHAMGKLHYHFSSIFTSIATIGIDSASVPPLIINYSVTSARCLDLYI